MNASPVIDPEHHALYLTIEQHVSACVHARARRSGVNYLQTATIYQLRAQTPAPRQLHYQRSPGCTCTHAAALFAQTIHARAQRFGVAPLLSDGNAFFFWGGGATPEIPSRATDLQIISPTPARMERLRKGLNPRGETRRLVVGRSPSGGTCVRGV